MLKDKILTYSVRLADKKKAASFIYKPTASVALEYFSSSINASVQTLTAGCDLDLGFINSGVPVLKNIK